MSDNTEKFQINAPGPYYVAKVCIGCTLCSGIAPDNFRENMDESLSISHSYVCKQPEGEAEVQLCEEAMYTCPVNAIRNDGAM
ncbi:MAG TPA: ferredoxin [Desulfosalsimonadaceae bacterium]|nr:ferredoxin [Desulfosalsimonadaceae bacterium]